MTSYLSRLSPIPSFPSYTGPYTVGTIDVELPTSVLESPSPCPNDTITTVQYRIFYPCEPYSDNGKKGKESIHWIPAPQRGYVSAYSRFLGAGSVLAGFISYFPGILQYITIPVHKNASLLLPTTKNGRWPVMVFSHGLGGSRNAYSHLIGSIASHGVVVIAPEHRDGSTPISYIRDVPSSNTSGGEKYFSQRQTKRTVDYLRLPHTPGPEVAAGRDAQLKIRLWELGLIHSSLLAIDSGNLPVTTNLNLSSIPLDIFTGKLNVQEPGEISWAGHSFGAATITQFVKSTFYSPLTSSAPDSYTPLFTPSSRSPIISQITPQTPVILLDVWCLPLRSPATRWLWDLPFPSYSPSPTAGQASPGGSALLCILSQAFFKWRVHLKATKRLLSPSPSSSSPSSIPPKKEPAFPPPHFYYITSSAHLSQSDFGILFPYLVRKVLGAEEPERVLRLNTRAILQLLRDGGIEVQYTSARDVEVKTGEKGEVDADEVMGMGIFSGERETEREEGTEGKVRAWNWLSTSLQGMEDVDDEEDSKGDSLST